MTTTVGRIIPFNRDVGGRICHDRFISAGRNSGVICAPVEVPSILASWPYKPIDTKLAGETKAGDEPPDDRRSGAGVRCCQRVAVGSSSHAGWRWLVEVVAQTNHQGTGAASITAAGSAPSC